MIRFQQRNDKDYFDRPQRVKDVTEGKTQEVRVADFHEAVDTLSQRTPDQYVIIDGRAIIPDNFYSAQNFGKRGSVVMLETFNGDADRLRGARRSELAARIEANERYASQRDNGPYIGWAWKGTDKRMHIVRPSVDVEGHRLHQFALTHTNINEKIKVYNTRSSGTNTLSVEVPSRSENDPYRVVLENVPRVRGDEKYAAWTRVSSRHDCDMKRNDFTFRWGGDITTYCPHDVAAYVAHSRQVAETTGEVIPQIFPMFTEPLLRLFMGAAHHTLIVDHTRKDGKPHFKTRPLSFPEIDTILMDAWLKHGNKQTFFVRDPKKQYTTGRPIGDRKRMRDYAWFDKNAPGLPFGNE